MLSRPVFSSKPSEAVSAQVAFINAMYYVPTSWIEHRPGVAPVHGAMNAFDGSESTFANGQSASWQSGIWVFDSEISPNYIEVLSTSTHNFSLTMNGVSVIVPPSTEKVWYKTEFIAPGDELVFANGTGMRTSIYEIRLSTQPPDPTPDPPAQPHIVPVGTYTQAEFDALPPAEQAQYGASDELQTHGASDRDFIVTNIDAPASLSKIEEMHNNWTQVYDNADEPLKSIAQENATVLINNAAKQSDGLQLVGMDHLRTEVAEFAELWKTYSQDVPDATQSFSDWLAEQ